ncbi:VWA domain-containing protein [Xanthobacter flavus]|uniref:VWA domain-containing protein n=1 Tax=Xanthobacter flavus TaxID=281 RepID=UPI001AE1DE18|nr:VWA domain-containing protein [Xanthobacter flavus]MBP2150935.1 Ca-activated chloride channel family protein [Xanthobacter flavus]
MSGFLLLRPWWLAALPLLAALAFWLWRRGPVAGGWGRVMPPTMLAAMRALGHLRRDDAGASLMPVAAAALVGLGLAGPAIPRADAPQLAGAGAVLVAVGLSPGVAGATLADAQAAAAGIMAAAAGRPVGLILYSDEAYDVAAPTGDPAVLESLIAVLGPDTMPSSGARPAAALRLARRMLEGMPDADLVLISDGSGIDAAARTEAARLATGGIRLFTLGLGVGSDKATSLEALGVASAPARAPGPVIDRLSGSAALARDGRAAGLAFEDLGPLVAALALVPFLALFRRRA